MRSPSYDPAMPGYGRDIASTHDSEWPVGGIDAEAALSALYDISVETDVNGRQAPYQYLVLLWAIQRARIGLPQPVPYLEVRANIADILGRFTLARSSPNVANPWFALRQTPWWYIPNPVGRYKDVLGANMAAGLSAQIVELIRYDPEFARCAVQSIQNILDDIGANPAQVDDLLLQLDLDDLPTYRLIPVEKNTVETFGAEHHAAPQELRTRHEAELQNAYWTYLVARGHELSSAYIRVDGQRLRLDLYDVTDHDLIEVKSTVDRNTIRLGLGQILDYARIMKPQRRTLLLPAKPAEGLIDLLHDHDVRVVFRDENAGFVCS